MKLFLCEKPSQANDIGKVVFGGISSENRKNGYLQKGDTAITWAVGHILQDAFPEKYGKQYEQWKLETLPLIPQKWIKEIPEKLADQFKIIERLLGKANEVIIATDADREGEVIAREILDYCGFKGKISRFWTSGLDAKSVRTALSKIVLRRFGTPKSRLAVGYEFKSCLHRCLCRWRGQRTCFIGRSHSNADFGVNRPPR